MAEKKVLCGANSYEQKYYFNKDFALIPEEIQNEIHIICVLFTEDVGGIYTMVFDEEGKLQLETTVSDGDYLYDEIESQILIRKITKTKQDLFKSLEMFYRVFILGESIEDAIKAKEEEED